ncbi:MAG: hypothetical protein QOE41_981 [Mycobacterium sp.]|jgi:hypothetical protein|nr:hypothetical protein [Mycobacterium sp.]MDT5131670.1 hypothetical protein [Mycobacterium sp.]
MIIETTHCPGRECECPGNRWWSGWVCAGEVHVVPIDDLRSHHSDGCECDPRIELHVGQSGFASWMVSHNSFDRRELAEPSVLQEY